MIENLNIYIVLITILLLVIIYISINQSKLYDKLINGFYEADTSFCEESGIDTFYLYLDNDINLLGERSCYILASKDNEIIINEPIVAKLKQQWSFWSDVNIRYFDVEFKDLSDDVIDIFPTIQTIRFYPVIGKMVIYSKDTVTAVLYKSGINTELKFVMDDDEIDDSEIDDSN